MEKLTALIFFIRHTYTARSVDRLVCWLLTIVQSEGRRGQTPRIFRHNNHYACHKFGTIDLHRTTAAR